MKDTNNSIQSIPLDKLKNHPDNPNRMGSSDFTKLVRNIEQTGRYEPLVVRPMPGDICRFQIINGHHRKKALVKLCYESADCLVWDIDDDQTDILLMTLNRLSGSDLLSKKLALLKRLNNKLQSYELAKLLPQSKTQIEKLSSLKMPAMPADPPTNFAIPMVFFLDGIQCLVMENAIALTQKYKDHKTRAAQKAAALTHIARYFIKNSV